MSKNPSNISQRAQKQRVLKNAPQSRKISRIKPAPPVTPSITHRLEDRIKKKSAVLAAFFAEEKNISNLKSNSYTGITSPETNYTNSATVGRVEKEVDATLEQSLGPFVEKYGVTKIAKFIIERASPDDRALIAGMAARDRMKKAASETTKAPIKKISSKSSTKTVKKKAYPPFTDLTPKEVEAVMRRGKSRPWNERRSFGYEWKTSVFDFICYEYTSWIPGLTQALLAKADEDLYNRFMKAISAEGLPAWLDVPSEADAELRKIADPVEREKRIINREYERERTQKRRASARHLSLG